MSKINDEVLNTAKEIVLTSYENKINLGNAEKEISTLTDAIIKTYRKLLNALEATTQN